MDLVGAEREVEQMVGTATPPFTGPLFPALGPATRPGPGRLAAARQALPHPRAHPGASPPSRRPARRAGRGAETTMPPPIGADGVSDHDLLSGFAMSDADAGAAFVRRFQGRVYGMAVNLLSDRGLAEAKPMAFVRAWKHAATYDPRQASVATWPLGITRNLAIRRLLHVAVESALDPQDGSGSPHPGRASHHRSRYRHRHIRPDRQGSGWPHPPASRASQGRLGWPPSTATPPAIRN